MKVGVVLIIEGNEHYGIPRYREVRSLAVAAEARGFDSLWLYDHLLFRNAGGEVGQWECFTFLSALAEATSSIELGTLVACTAFRNPALTVKIATALDEVSGGRFTLGLGAGWNEAEFRAFGLPFDHRVARFAEALEVIGPLLRQGRVDFSGQYYQAPDCVDIPRRAQGPGPRLLVGATGERMVRLAAQWADAINGGVDLADPRGRIDAACAAVGRDPASLELTTPLWVAFPDLGPTPQHMGEHGYAEAGPVAQALHRLALAGVAHVMVDLRPNSEAALERLAEAVTIFRGMALPDQPHPGGR